MLRLALILNLLGWITLVRLYSQYQGTGTYAALGWMGIAINGAFLTVILALEWKRGRRPSKTE
jgi:hypothetical protein